jgi:hypothetical protein
MAEQVLESEVADSCIATAIEKGELPSLLTLSAVHSTANNSATRMRKSGASGVLKFVGGVQDGRLEWRSVAHHALRFGEQQPHLLRARLEILADLAQEVGHVLGERHNLDSEVGRAVAEAVGQFTVG